MNRTTSIARWYLSAMCATMLVMTADTARAFSPRRLIVAFGESGSPSFLVLEEAVRQVRCRLVDRDVDVVFIDLQELRAIEPGTTDSDIVRRAMAVRSNASDRTDGFELVLIGKDGSVKSRQRDPAALDTLLDLIDTMPMRRAEVRRAGGKVDRDC